MSERSHFSGHAQPHAVGGAENLSAPRGSGVALFAVTFSAQCWLLRDFCADDAYIVLRYAENLVRHAELTFNRGERVSALTSPLHALLMAALRSCFEDALRAYKVLSWLAMLAAFGLAVRQVRGRLNSLLIALVACCPFLAVWTVGGLETPLLTFLFMAITALAIRWSQAERPGAHLGLLHFVAGLAFLVRFDAVLFLSPILAAIAWRSRNRPAQILSALLLGALPPVSWMLFSASYYGSILPTSFYVKAPTWNAMNALRNGIYISCVVTMSTLIIPIAIRLHKRHTAAARSSFAPHAPLAAGLVLHGLYALSTATTHMMFSARILLPCFLPAATLALIGLDWEPTYSASSRHLRLLIPALWLLQALQTGRIYNSSLNGFIPVGEYRHEGAAAYADSFLPALLHNADAIEQDWQTASVARAPSVYTFAAGALPLHLLDSYVVEKLVSQPLLQHHGVDEVLDCIDYAHLLVPRHGSVEKQLGRHATGARLVDSRVELFDGTTERFEVYALSSTQTAPQSVEACLSALPQRVR